MDFRRIVGIALTMLVLSPCFASPDTSLSARMTRQMQVNRDRYGIVGQAVLVSHRGEVVFRGADGVTDLVSRKSVAVDSVFEMFSVAKLFVSTLVMQLVEQGKVGLDEPASRYVKGLPEAWRRISVREFLDHASGVPEYFGEDMEKAVFPATMAAVFDGLANKPLLFPPGSDVRYTQTNYLVLSALLEAVYGKPYPQIARERIIDRLHLSHTWLGIASVPPDNLMTIYKGKDDKPVVETRIAWPTYTFGHSSLYSTLDDMQVFLQALADGKLVGKAALARFWSDGKLPNGKPGWFATGWDYGDSDGYRQVGHDGGTHVRVRLLYKGALDGDVYTVIYLTNGSGRNVWSRTLVDSAMAVASPTDFPVEVLAEKQKALGGSTNP